MKKIYKEYDEILHPYIKEANYYVMFMTIKIIFYILLLFITLNLPNNSLPINNAIETNSFAIRCLKKNQPAINEFASQLENDYNVLLSKFQLNHTEKIIVDIYPDSKTFNQTFDITDRKFTQIPVVMKKNKLSIVMPQGEQIDYENDATYKVIKHELVYYIINSYIFSSPNNTWLNECIALYYAKQIPNADEVNFVINNKYPTIDELNGPRFQDLYILGYSLSEFIASKWSEDKLIELISANSNFEMVLTTDKESFEKDWHEYLQKKYIYKLH